VRDNGCNEDGWDLYEQQTREAFEFIACRTGFSLKRDEECPWMYAEKNTQDCWRMFHSGHVKGRGWIV